MSHKVFLRTSSIAVLLMASGVSFGQVIYNPATQWDIVNNPSANGPWTYGYKTSVAGTLTLLNTPVSDNRSGAVQLAWLLNSGLPGVGYNSSTTIDWTDGPTVINPGEINLHPGSTNLMPVLRFTAPQAGTYTFVGNFNGNSGSGTSTTAYLVQNGSTFFSTAVNGFNTVFTFNESRSALAGDFFDIVVDWGSNGSHANDSTGLVLAVTAVPEPSAYAAIAGLGALGLVLWRRRVRRA